MGRYRVGVAENGRDGGVPQGAGTFFSKVGGYLGPDTVKYIFIANIFGAIFAIGSVFCYSPMAASFFIMMELFFGAFIMPAACGIMLN